MMDVFDKWSYLIFGFDVWLSWSLALVWLWYGQNQSHTPKLEIPLVTPNNCVCFTSRQRSNQNQTPDISQSHIKPNCQITAAHLIQETHQSTDDHTSKLVIKLQSCIKSSDLIMVTHQILLSNHATHPSQRSYQSHSSKPKDHIRVTHQTQRSEQKNTSDQSNTSILKINW